jgi:hypothetical protein
VRETERWCTKSEGRPEATSVAGRTLPEQEGKKKEREDNTRRTLRRKKQRQETAAERQKFKEKTVETQAEEIESEPADRRKR